MAVGAGIAAVAGGAKAISSKNQASSAQSNADWAHYESQVNQQLGIQSLLDYFSLAEGNLDEQMEFLQGTLSDWEETFGGIEDNLSEYYKNLDPVKYASTYKSNLNENIDKQLTQLNENMAATGLQTAGMKQQAEKEAAFAKATGGAQADIAAEDKVMSMKQGFLNSGQSQRNFAQQGIVNTFTSKSNLNTSLGANLNNAYQGNASMANKNQNMYTGIVSDSKDSMRDGIGSMFGGIAGMF